MGAKLERFERAMEPAPDAPWKTVLARARKCWSQTGHWPDWYHRRKKELDKPKNP